MLASKMKMMTSRSLSTLAFFMAINFLYLQEHGKVSAFLIIASETISPCCSLNVGKRQQTFLSKSSKKKVGSTGNSHPRCRTQDRTNVIDLWSSAKNDNNDSILMKMTNRKDFFQRVLVTSSFLVLGRSTCTSPQPSMAFDGGVGGLGKTRPDTGVIFRNSNVDETNNKNVGGGGGLIPNSAGGDISVELLSPDDDETPVILSFHAPWPMSRSASGIESRDLTNPEGAYVQVSNIPKSLTTSSLKKDDNSGGVILPNSFFMDALFGPKGKYGMYGTPTDVKVKKLPPSPNNNNTTTTSLYLASFTTLTPAMRESERKAYIATSIIGNTVFMLVTGTTSTRFKSQNDVLLQTANSFACVPAPKSKLKTTR